MKNVKKIPKYYISLLIAFLLLTITTVLYINILRITKLANEKPQDLVFANISTVETKIYWKSNTETIYRISYKPKRDTGLFKTIYDYSIYTDNVKKQRVYEIPLSELIPETEYILRVEDENSRWKEEYTFSTRSIAEEIDIPNIQTGTSSIMSFLLVDIDGDMYMLDTQYHGTWAFDSKGKEYTTRRYSTYITNTELSASLNDLLITPLYAASGANCKTGIKVNDTSYTPSKDKVVDILKRFVSGCPEGTYAQQCYEDVYCRSIKAGVDPAFAITIWTNESGGSNYAYRPRVGDFGIANESIVPYSDFDKQLSQFLKIVSDPSYIQNCSKDSNYSATVKWGAKFLTGDCNSTANLEKGREYMSSISNIYKWYNSTRLPLWPFNTTPNSNICDYSNAKTNTTYNSCTAQGSSNTSPSNSESDTPKESKTNVPTGGDGIKDYMIVSGSGVTPKDRNCKDPDGCICLYKYNSSSESTLTIKNGYTCTTDKKVIVTPVDQKVCCLKDDTASYQLLSKCDGKVLESVKEIDCKVVNKTMEIGQGINFIKTNYILDTSPTKLDTAYSIINSSVNNILAVGSFRNDTWENIVKNENGTISGGDFPISSENVYMIVSKESFSLPVLYVKMEPSVKIDTLVGWNLVPSESFSNAGNNSKSILQSTQYTNVKQVAVWNNGTSIFDYTIKDNSGSIYGEQTPISNIDGIFVKVSQ